MLCHIPSTLWIFLPFLSLIAETGRPIRRSDPHLGSVEGMVTGSFVLSSEGSSSGSNKTVSQLSAQHGDKAAALTAWLLLAAADSAGAVLDKLRKELMVAVPSQ
eukprot:749841-Hanusia_phi.AAC.3